MGDEKCAYVYSGGGFKHADAGQVCRGTRKEHNRGEWTHPFVPSPPVADSPVHCRGCEGDGAVLCPGCDNYFCQGHMGTHVQHRPVTDSPHPAILANADQPSRLAPEKLIASRPVADSPKGDEEACGMCGTLHASASDIATHWVRAFDVQMPRCSASYAIGRTASDAFAAGRREGLREARGAVHGERLGVK